MILKISALLFLLLVYINFSFKENFNVNVDEFKKPKNWAFMGFSEKLRYYGSSLSSKYSLYSDKYLVKRYIENLKIKDLYVPKTLKVFELKSYTYLEDLPKNCVIKTNNGSGDIVKIKNNKIVLIRGRGKTFKNNIESFNHWKKLALKPIFNKYEKHYIDIQPVIFAEEDLGSNIRDYKFFCIKGEVILFHIDSDRFTKTCRNIYDVNFKKLPFSKGDPNCVYDISRPKNLNKMLKICKKISNKFEFSRVDLYDINGNIYFGEITFVPAAGTNDFRPIVYDKIIGSLWK
jgi:hypothetical protein